jgi:predicted ATPase
MTQIQKITIRGYKSIAKLENFKLQPLNILIGANGAGKSNFIGIFKLLAALADGNLQTFVQKQGGPDALLHGSRNRTQQIDAEIFSREETWIEGHYAAKAIPLGTAHDEAKLRDAILPKILPGELSFASTYAEPAA